MEALDRLLFPIAWIVAHLTFGLVWLYERVAALSPIERFNAGLALAGMLIAIGAVNRMHTKTECTIILSFATIAAGLFGYAIGSLLPQSWQQICDTLWLGGAAALLTGSRKQTIWIAPAWMPRISLGISVCTWGAFLWGIK